MNPSDLDEVLHARRSIRRYEKRGVPRQLLNELIEAARWAPSAHNRQPWRFVVVESAETKRALATAMADRFRTDLERDGVAQDVARAQVSNSIARLTSAPVLIVVNLTMRDMDRYPDPRRKHCEWVMAVQSTALAVQNLLLAAQVRGLGACWMCAPLFAPDTVREILALDADWEPQALVTLGYPAESNTKDRLALESVVKYVDPEERL